MNDAIVNEIAISQANQQNQDATTIGRKVLKVTIKCHPLSANNVWVGVNQPASDSNVLQPGESVTYHDERVYLDRNKYYVGFDPAGSGGRAIVSIISDTEQENC